MSGRSPPYAAIIGAGIFSTIGRASFVTPDSSIVAYSEKIIAQLTQKVPELTENRALRTRLMESLATIACEFRDRASQVEKSVPIEPIWADFMNDPAFRLSLWSSQRIAFVAFYNAYEVFLIDCMKVSTGLASLRTTMDEFRKALRNALREDIADPCWFHSEINIARLVRHSLSHNGGRQIEDLKKQKHNIKLIGDDLQIVPEDIHFMLRRLRKAVEKVIAVTRDTPKFIAPAAELPPPHEDED